jgi:hypothetical protein
MNSAHPPYLLKFIQSNGPAILLCLLPISFAAITWSLPFCDALDQFQLIIGSIKWIIVFASIVIVVAFLFNKRFPFSKGLFSMVLILCISESLLFTVSAYAVGNIVFDDKASSSHLTEIINKYYSKGRGPSISIFACDFMAIYAGIRRNTCFSFNI